MKEQFFTLKEVKLNNNCPECYSTEGLHIVFKQKLVENAFYKAITVHTTHSMSCSICHTEIFPVRWTDAIEQVVSYQKRAVSPKPKSVKLKKITWILIAISILIITGVLLMVTGVLGAYI